MFDPPYSIFECGAYKRFSELCSHNYYYIFLLLPIDRQQHRYRHTFLPFCLTQGTSNILIENSISVKFYDHYTLCRYTRESNKKEIIFEIEINL